MFQKIRTSDYPKAKVRCPALKSNTSESPDLKSDTLLNIWYNHEMLKIRKIVNLINANDLLFYGAKCKIALRSY